MANEAAFISQIESYLVDKLSTVSKYVYAGSLPSTIPTNIPKTQYGFVVVDCATAVNDYGGYNQGMINIYLYGKQTASGRKDTNAFYNLEKAYAEFLENSDSKDYAITEVYRQADYDSTYGMYFIVSAINLIVK
jgi:hypothetical protein